MSNQIAEVSRVYASTLLELAKEQNEVDVVLNNLVSLKEAINANSDFIKIMTYPNFDNDKKKQIIKDILKMEENYFLHFIYVLIDNNRFVDFNDIVDAYQILVDLEKDLYKAQVYTKFKLSEAQLENIKTNLENKFKKNVLIEEIVDNTILGGIKVMVNSYEYDYTIDSQLGNLKEIIMKG